MLSVHNISVSFGGVPLFSEVTFRLHAGDRVGLIGKNGAGKSTLLKVLAGELQPDEGTVAWDKAVNAGLLRQDIEMDRGETLLEETYKAFPLLRGLEKKMEGMQEQVVSRTDYESDAYHELLVAIDDIRHQYQVLGGYDYPGETEKVLQGLGFKREDFGRYTDTFSGGWRMRIELAKLLLQRNDLMLLDEPTNHLDMDAIIWLEQFLKSYSGAVVIVSHDKMFLDTVTNRTIELSLGRMYDSNKPYSRHLALRQEMRVQQLAAQKNQQKHIQHTQQLIEKFRAKASKAAMAQSLIKKLDKMELIEVDEEDSGSMNIGFPVSVQPGKVVLEVRNVSKNYGEKQVLENIQLLVERGSKIAFVGQNGQGKTTLAKIIVGELAHEGVVKLGHKVQLGYFAQNQADYLDGELSVQETLLNAATDESRPNVRGVLGAFLFRGDEVEKKVKVLSGGERNRLALARMLLQPFNVLVMDEPTNHLDISSKNVLKKALQNFQGTLILVSHDRDFLQDLVQKVYEFRNCHVKEFLGDITFYLEERKLQSLRDIEKAEKSTLKAERGDRISVYERQKKMKVLQNRVNKVELDISKLEKELAEAEQSMAVTAVTKPDVAFFETYRSKKERLKELLLDWETLHLSIDDLRSNET